MAHRSASQQSVTDNQVQSSLYKLQPYLHSLTDSGSTHSFRPVLGKTTNRGLFCSQTGSSHFTTQQPVSEHRSACSTWSLRGQEGTMTHNDRKEKRCWSEPTQRFRASRFQGQSRKSNNLCWQGWGQNVKYKQRLLCNGLAWKTPRQGKSQRILCLAWILMGCLCGKSLFST